MSSYYTRNRGRVLGPFTEEQLRTMVQRGQLSRIHEISADGTNWASAQEYPQFFTSNLVSSSQKGVSDQEISSTRSNSLDLGALKGTADLNDPIWHYEID